MHNYLIPLCEFIESFDAAGNLKYKLNLKSFVASLFEDLLKTLQLILISISKTKSETKQYKKDKTFSVLNGKMNRWKNEKIFSSPVRVVVRFDINAVWLRMNGRTKHQVMPCPYVNMPSGLTSIDKTQSCLKSSGHLLSKY